MIGLYCLCIKVKRRIVLEVGALGERVFDPGLYIYVGSAMRGLEQRLRRHLRISSGKVRSFHWHIDYLLREEGVMVERVYIREGEGSECYVAFILSGSGRPVRGFGCSDCRCPSHLIRVDSCDLLQRIGFKPLDKFRLH